MGQSQRQKTNEPVRLVLVHGVAVKPDRRSDYRPDKRQTVLSFAGAIGKSSRGHGYAVGLVVVPALFFAAFLAACLALVAAETGARSTWLAISQAASLSGRFLNLFW